MKIRFIFLLPPTNLHISNSNGKKSMNLRLPKLHSCWLRLERAGGALMSTILSPPETDERLKKGQASGRTDKACWQDRNEEGRRSLKGASRY